MNNAGAAWGAPAEEHPVAAWDKVMDLNVRGYFILGVSCFSAILVRFA
jgi:gluconate 5-dehydrogenase